MFEQQILLFKFKSKPTEYVAYIMYAAYLMWKQLKLVSSFLPDARMDGQIKIPKTILMCTITQHVNYSALSTWTHLISDHVCVNS